MVIKYKACLFINASIFQDSSEQLLTQYAKNDKEKAQNQTSILEERQCW